MGECPPPVYPPPEGCDDNSPCYLQYLETRSELQNLWLDDPETHCPQFLEGNETAYHEAENCCAQSS